MDKLTCFKSYDIRGKLGEELNEDVAYRIGRAYGQYLKANKVVVGGDARETSENLKLELARGLQDSGVDVTDIGLVGTEEIYFATSDLKMDGGIIVTASHNPINYNGMKLVRENSKPISGDTGLTAIKELAEANVFAPVQRIGNYSKVSNLNSYISHLLTYISPENFKPMKLVVNSGNGVAGHVIDALEERFSELNIPVEFIKVHHKPDHTFPNGIPNPLLPENRVDTSNAVKEHGADMGIAWDGDFDRCFLFDENGEFIEGAYIVGLLAEAFLQKNSDERIIYDPRVYWNTEDTIRRYNGTPVMSKSGHAFIKERMRTEDAVYGGEMSAHHYFRDFAYCDSGMIPWLLVAELVCTKTTTLASLMKERIEHFPCSGEINFKGNNNQELIKKLEEYNWGESYDIVRIDGLDFIFSRWRFNIRKSSTEPLIRLNIETKTDEELLMEKIKLLSSILFGEN